MLNEKISLNVTYAESYIASRLWANEYDCNVRDIIESGAYDAAVELMDDELRKKVVDELQEDCLEIDFLQRYAELHLEKFGEEFTV